MSILFNPRHERFAREIAGGRSASEAYIEAGYSANDGNASRLKGNERVRARVVELQRQAVTQTIITLQWLIDRAEEARAGAMAAGQHSAAVAAIKELGILSGCRVERCEQGEPGEFDGLSADELRQQIADRLGFAEKVARPAGRTRRKVH